MTTNNRINHSEALAKALEHLMAESLLGGSVPDPSGTPFASAYGAANEVLAAYRTSQSLAPSSEVPHWLNPESDHPERQFAEWLNERRMSNVSSVFHEIMGKYREALAFQAPAVGADAVVEVARAVMERHEREIAGRICSEWTEMATLRRVLSNFPGTAPKGT